MQRPRQLADLLTKYETNPSACRHASPSGLMCVTITTDFAPRTASVAACHCALFVIVIQIVFFYVVKVFRRDILQQINLVEDRFGFEPEVTAKVAALHCRVYEVSISYEGRSYDAGKKIGWKDGLRTIWCILKFNTWARQRSSLAPRPR
jgi:hypothetical protein